MTDPITVEEMARLAIDGSGNVLLAWRKIIDDETAGMYASRFAAAGSAWLAPVQVGQTTGAYVHTPSLSVSDLGLGAVAFCYQGADFDGVEVAMFR